MSDTDSSSSIIHGTTADLNAPPTTEQSTNLDTANSDVKESEHPGELTWPQIRLILKNGAEQTISAMQAAINSSTHTELSEPLLTCAICRQPYHSPNDDGEIERPALAACGHVFGHSCIERWVSRPMPHVGPNCPVCRFQLKFRVCKHPIAAVAPYDEENPPPVVLQRESDVPAMCSKCSLRAQKWHKTHRDLMRRKDLLSSEIATLNVTMTIHLLTRNNEEYEAKKQLNRAYRNELRETEQRLPDVESMMSEEEELFLKEVRDSRRWHLKADTAKWRVTGEHYEDESDDEEEEGYSDDDFSDGDEDGDDGLDDTDDDNDDDNLDIEDLTNPHHDHLHTGYDSGEDSGDDLDPSIYRGGATTRGPAAGPGNVGDNVS